MVHTLRYPLLFKMFNFVHSKSLFQFILSCSGSFSCCCSLKNYLSNENVGSNTKCILTKISIQNIKRISFLNPLVSICILLWESNAVWLIAKEVNSIRSVNKAKKTPDKQQTVHRLNINGSLKIKCCRYLQRS